MAQKKTPVKKSPPKSMLRAELNATMGAEILRQAAKNLEDRPTILATISRFAQGWEREVFSSKGGARGEQWKPLAASTRGAMLVRTGALKAAATSKPKIKKASVEVRVPGHAAYLIAGRFAENSKDGTGRRKGVEGLGGSMPRRNPIPRPPRERLAILTGDILAGVTPKG